MSVLLLTTLACNYPGISLAPLPRPLPSPSIPASAPEPEASLTASRTPAIPTGIPAPILSPTFAYQPAFEPAACAFPIPPGTDPECGYLVVPENRAFPDSPSIRLHVAIFRSRAAGPAPDPVVHLAGGPGSSSLESAGYLFQQGLGAILDRRDFILFDQRGAGYSQPRLDCPERSALADDLLGGSLAGEQAAAAIVAAFQGCHDRLAAQGIDLAAYTSAASAADLDDLRRALGYDRLNLYAVSYGTRLALTLLRDFPEAARSAVLDSAYPPQANLYIELASNAERAFSTLFDSCAANSECNAAYPDLRGTFYALVDRLNAEPQRVRLQAGGEQHTVLLDGGRLIDVLFTGLYNPAVTASMPEMIFAVRDGDYTVLRRRLALYYESTSALGMMMSVQCSEEIPFAGPQDVAAAAQGVQPQIPGYYTADIQPLFAACLQWHPTPPDPRENQPVVSDTPALILAGELDPITPPDWGRRAAATLSHAYFYEYPGNGHWVTRSSGCALQMVLAFWDDPGQAPGSDCIQTMPGLEFTP